MNACAATQANYVCGLLKGQAEPGRYEDAPYFDWLGVLFICLHGVKKVDSVI